MKHWFSSPLGKYTIRAQDNILKSALMRRFGYHMLQIGCAELPLYESSPIGHKFSLGLSAPKGESWVCANPESLPLGNESIDLVLLHHSLETSAYPHQLLREVSRVLISGGYIYICGFNPASMWGIRKLFNFKKDNPWKNHLLTTKRLTDWLKLLDFQIMEVKYAGYCLPINSESWIRYSAVLENIATKLNWPTGGLYIICAKKQVAPLTPIQNKWRKFPANVGLPVTENVSKVSTRLDND